MDSAQAKKKGYLKLADYFGSKETSSRTVRIYTMQNKFSNCMGQSINIGSLVSFFGIKIQAFIIGQGFSCNKLQDFQM